MNLYTYLLENHQPDTDAILSRQEGITYGDLIREVDGIAVSLLDAGIRKGEYVGLVAANSAFWVASYLAILKLGAVAVPFSTKATDLQERLHLVPCKVFCADTPSSRKLMTLLSNESTFIVPLSEYAKMSTANLNIVTPCLGKPCKTIEVSPESDLAALMFTSGSTGTPNAVKVTHQNIIANTESIIQYLELSLKDRILVILPFDYCFGTSLLHTHLRVGGQLVLNNKFVFMEDALDDLEGFSCTGFAGVPTVYQQMIERSTLLRRELKTLRYVQQAGGRLHERFIRQFVNNFPQVRFFVMYGQTEATARLSYLPPSQLSDKMGSIGRGIPGVVLRVVDENGVDVEPGQIGEIVAQGKNVAAGYLIPDPNQNVFRNGLLYTGDLAELDDEGFIYIVGRKKDFIKPSGYRIACAQIENVLLEMPEIIEVAIVGGVDDVGGEVPIAYIVLRPNMEVEQHKILEYCKRHLPFYGIPHEIVFVPDLPKNASGKVLKQILKTTYHTRF